MRFFYFTTLFVEFNFFLDYFLQILFYSFIKLHSRCLSTRISSVVGYWSQTHLSKVAFLINKNSFQGDELFSDSYPMNLNYDDLVYEVDGKLIKESADIDEALIGGNKAQEAQEDEEGVDSSVVQGNPKKQTYININMTLNY